MFDLEQNLRRWRQEIEATLAFSAEEVDELEDHLRLSFEAKIKEGHSPEKAWCHSLGGLGSSSELALEFAQAKLMPALGRLLLTWWQPALLLFLLSLTFVFSLQKTGQWILDGTLPPGPWAPVYQFLGVTGLTLLVTLILLPRRAHKNAVLAGIGNAVCLIPLLNFLFYNSISEKIVGTGWSHMATSFGWLPLWLSLIGMIFINRWWWLKSRTASQNFPAMLAIAATIVLVFTLSPFCGELIGNLSIRELYRLPTADQITLTGDARTKYLNFEFVAVLVNSMVFIQNFQPFVLMAVASLGLVFVQCATRGSKLKRGTSPAIFPAAQDLSWIMVLITSGVFWVINGWLEPSFSERIREVEKSISLPANSHGGTEIVVLFSAALFFIAAYELTRRLRRSRRIRPFYASLLVGAELCSLAWIIPRTANAVFHSGTAYDHSSEPVWLTCLFVALVGVIVWNQISIIRARVRSDLRETSLWQYNGKDLVELGLLLGLIIACSGLLLFMVAMDMAYVSVTFITALIAWGTSIAKPATSHFHPQDYGISNHLSLWAVVGVGYGCLCLALGLGAVILLSALEFIRFNCFRIYKIRKAKQGRTEALALNE